MPSEFSLVFDIREAGFPWSPKHFLGAFLLMGGLLLIGLAVPPRARKVMQSFMDAWPVRIPYPLFAGGYLLFITGLFLPDAYGDYAAYRTLIKNLRTDQCKRIAGTVQNYNRRMLGVRSNRTYVTFRVNGVSFRYSNYGGPGYHDVDGPLREELPVRITYCGRRRAIARLETGS